MDKLALELVGLLRELLAAQRRLLQLALNKREAMRAFEIDRLENLNLQERTEIQVMSAIDLRRKGLVSRIKQILGKHVEATVSEVSRRVAEPLKSQLLALAAEIKTVVEQVERNNASIDTVVKRVGQGIEGGHGPAQHAGLYYSNGRKAALRGIHLPEITA